MLPVAGQADLVEGEGGEVSEEAAEAVHRHSVVGAAGGRLAQGGGRALRRGDDGFAFGRCGGAVVVVEQDGRQAAAHVEFDVVGEHAEEDVGAHAGAVQ